MFSVYEKTPKSVLFACILIINCLFTTAQNDGEACTLPDGRKSACMRIHYCQSLFDPIKLIRGPLPANLEKNLKDHQCTRNNVVCCPDGVAQVTGPQVAAQPTNDITSKLHPRADIDRVESHRNINLINSDTCGLKSTNRIVGGKAASLGEFPWNALLRYSSAGDLSFNCGGTLISKKYVLTAAHCISSRLELVSVRLGEHKISNVTDCEINEDEVICADPVQDIPVETTVKHANYSNKNKINDIAIIRLRRDAVLNGYVKTICLPTQRRILINNIETSATMSISGWGRIETGNSLSDNLLKAIVPYVTNKDCAARLKSENVPVYSSYLCAGGHNKTDTCQGDSGGGITAITSFKNKPRMLLYGVVSGGIDCQNSLVIFPGIFSDTAYYADWILDNMRP